MTKSHCAVHGTFSIARELPHGYDDAGSRERGTGALMDALAKSLDQ